MYKKKVSSSWVSDAWRMTLRNPSRWDKIHSFHLKSSKNNLSSRSRSLRRNPDHYPYLSSSFSLYIFFRHDTNSYRISSSRRITSYSKGEIVHPSQTRARYTTSRLLSSLVTRLFSNFGWTCPTYQSLHIILKDIQMISSSEANSYLLNSVLADSSKSRRRLSIIMTFSSHDDSLLKMIFHVSDVISLTPFLRRLPHVRCFPQHLAHNSSYLLPQLYI